MSVHVTADWHDIGHDQYFRKTELYTMGWSSSTSIPINLDNFALVGGTYGGFLAIIKDDKKITRVTANMPVKPIISIFTPSGHAMASIRWDSGVLVKMGWSSSEDLLCVQEDGNVLVYSIFGLLTDTFHCLAEYVTKEKAFEAEIYPSTNGTGIAFLTTKENFIILNNYKYATTKCYARVPGGGPFNSWTVRNVKRETTIIVSKDSVIYSINMGQCEIISTVDKLFSTYKNQDPQTITNLPLVIYISISLNGENIAAYTDNGLLWIGSSDFTKKYCEYNIGNTNRPKQIAWCGTEAVTLSWESVPYILLINRSGDELKFPVEGSFYLIPEIDCVRVVSNYTYEIIQKIPENTKLIFGIGSVAPGSWLLEAFKEFSQKSHKADDYIKCIEDIEEAVQQCIETAGYEFEPTNQKLLMKAAQFGKSFLIKYSPESYVHMCQMLRILNAVKDYRVAMPLTFTQLDHMSIAVLIDRLILRRQYSLAFRIADFLKLRNSQGKSRILSRWACHKVGQMNIDEDQLAADIYAKLKTDPSISYSEIANKAFDTGRKKLALSLAQYEARGSIQVPLFLKLGDTKTALSKAVENGNPELIYDVLIKLRESMPSSQFQLLIRNYPVAQSLYIKYCEIFCPEAVRNIYETEDDYSAQAILSIHESYKEKRIETRMASLQQAQQLYIKGKNDFAASLCEEQNKLLKHQLALEQQYHNSFVNLSLRDTIKALLVIKEVKIADKLRAEYKVSDRMFWLIRLRTLGELHDWSELEKLSKTKKLPVGFEDFVEVCLQYKNRAEAYKYLPKVKDALQIKYYVQAGYYEEAAKLAVTRKDLSELEYVYAKSLSADRDVAAKVKDIMDSLKAPAGSSSMTNSSASSSRTPG